MEHTFSSRTTHVREHTCEAPGKFDIVTTRAIHPLRRSAAAAAHNPRLHNCGATCHPSSPNNWSMYRGHVICWVKGSVVRCMFCFEICTPERRVGEKGGSANFIRKHMEPLTQEITSPLYLHPSRVLFGGVWV